MWAKFVIAVAAMLLNGCASSRSPDHQLPPPPPQPAAVDPAAESIDSSFLLLSREKEKLLKRAKAGDPEAAFRLSFHFMSAGDRVQSKYWQLSAAKHGHPVAQYNQWFDLKDEKDCVSMKRALSWLKAAVENGDEDAREELEAYTQRVRSCRSFK